MHPLPATLALGAALLLASARPAHAGDAAASGDARDAASRPPSFAGTLVQRPEVPGLVLLRIREDAPTLENERGSSPHDEAGRARPKAKIAVGRPKGASVTTGSSSLQPRAGWVGVTLQF